jgi:hypothetical protein
MFGLSKLATRIGLALIAAVLLLGLMQLRACSNARQTAAQERVEDAQAGAAGNSAADAIATQANVNAGERAAAELDRTNEKEIRDAPGADQAVDAAVDAAGRRSLCRRAAYRDRPECRLLAAPAR